MCAVSAILDYGRQQYPGKPIEQFPNYWMDWVKLMQAAKEFDKKNKEPDCEDPNKFPFLKEIMERLEAIEKKLG